MTGKMYSSIANKRKAGKLKYGWVPDIPDKRDIVYSAVHKVSVPLPPSVDLRLYCSAVEDQGELGSCTANALVGALEFLENKDKIPFRDLGRLFVYYNERVLENTVDSDSGAQLRDGIKVLAKYGVCPERSYKSSQNAICHQIRNLISNQNAYWPYDISKFTVKPSTQCYIEALSHKITAYQRLFTIADMRHCLADGYPFVFGFSVYENFESEAVANTGILPMPKSNEQFLGGHAVLAVGYDMGKKIFPTSIGSGLIRNSWGNTWGKGGYFWMPLEYLADRNLSDDFWTIRRGGGL
jgi:C1A family cysteine protease